MRRLSLLPMLLVLVSCGTDDVAALAVPDGPFVETSRAAKAPRFVATEEIEGALRALAAELQATYGLLRGARPRGLDGRSGWACEGEHGALRGRRQQTAGHRMGSR